MSETGISDFVACQRMIRALELKLERLEHGLAMPRDEDAIAQTKALLKEAERAGWQALNEQSIHPSENFGPKSA